MIDFVKIPEERIKMLKADPRIQKKFEELCQCKLQLNEQEQEVQIECDDGLMMLKAKDVLKAFGRGFSSDDALYLLDDDYYLEIINITEFVGKDKDRVKTMKGRLIGAEGHSKKTIEKDTNCKTAIYGKSISIIGKWDDVLAAKKVVLRLLYGSKHSTVYRMLEERKKFKG
ncbi:MAG TPA: hypothetical protein VJJ76_03155 [archaeon]|nr:hypothetical protein [archaeon]